MTNRRTVLKASGTALAAGLAGCSTIGGSGGGGGGTTPQRPADVTSFPPSEYESQLNIWNWYNGFAEYAQEELPNSFEELETVTTSSYSSATEPYNQVQSGSHEIDNISMSTSVAAEAFNNDDLEPLPVDSMPNYSNLTESARQNARDHFSDSDGNIYAIPETFGMWPALGYSSNEFDSPPDSWDVMWDSEYEGRIALQDNAIKTGYIGAKYTGQDWRDPDDFEDIREALIQQKELNRTYWQSFQQGMQLFINESVVLGTHTMARLFFAHYEEGATHVEYAVPQEGALTYHDFLVIPKGAPNPVISTAFLNWSLQTEHAKQHYKQEGYLAPVNDIFTTLQNDGTLTEESSEFLQWSDEQRERLEFHAPLDPEVRQNYVDMWNAVKSA